MAKFVELAEAARMLGLTPEKLVEMRSNGEIHGYRDGASWKFKAEEIDRVKAELAGMVGDLIGSGSELDLSDAPITVEGLLDESDEPKKKKGSSDASVLGSEHEPSTDDSIVRGDSDPGSILVSEEELGESAETPSTIIGRGGDVHADSDLALTPDDGGSALSFVPGAEGTDLSLTPGSGVDSELALEEALGGSSALAESDVALVPGVGSSDVSLIPDPGSEQYLDSAGLSDVLSDDSELKLEVPSSASGRGKMAKPADTGSGDLDAGLGSELALSDDDDVVLSGSSGSALGLGAGDSGINLSSPTDSGLSLEADSGIQLQSPTDSGLSLEEEPLDLGGSSISSLELPDEDEVVELDESMEPVAVKKDEEFLLMPSGEMAVDESDSGSQVIALEDSEAFDAIGGQPMLTEAEQPMVPMPGMGPMAGPGAVPTYAGPVAWEAPYSIWNIMGLLLIVMFLSLAGILVTDMMKNMWSWQSGGPSVATGISEGLTKAMGMTD